VTQGGIQESVSPLRREQPLPERALLP